MTDTSLPQDLTGRDISESMGIANASHRHPYKRIAIVNRNETAMRLIRAVRELNREGQPELTTIALFTEPDRHAMFVHEADDAVSIGAATFIDPEDKQRKSSYLNRARIKQALIATHADAAWVGWGLISEEPWFAELCQQLGIVFIGPDAQALHLFADKIRTKQLAKQIGIPIVPPPLFLERAMDDAQHIEVQIIADTYGTTWAVGVRDCTVQHQQRKVCVATASAILSTEQEQALRDAALHLCQAARYYNAATVEFLYDYHTQQFWLQGVNPCLSAEHPVTEVTTGLDLVKLQLQIAQGEPLTGEPPTADGHAIEVGLYAEDPDNSFAPGPGTLDLFRLASGPGLRIDTGFNEGDVIAPGSDLMLGRIIAWGRNRREARARLSRALSESAIVVRGGMSNKAFLLDFLSRPELDEGTIDIGWLDRLVEQKDHHQPLQYADVALLQAAIEVYDDEAQVELAQFYTSAARGRPRARLDSGISTNLQYLGQIYQLTVARLGPQHYRITIDGQKIDARIERIGTFERRTTCFGQRHRVLSVMHGPNHLVEVDGVTHRIVHEEGGIVRAPGPAVVVTIAVAPGERIEVGDRLAVVEAMKMEMTITARFAGRVAQIFVTSNVQVDTGAPLLQLEPLTRQDDLRGDKRIHFGQDTTEITHSKNIQELHEQVFETLHNQMLGYDIDQEGAKQLLNELSTVYKTLPPDDRELLRGENEILSIFADISALFRRALDPAEAQEEDEQVHSAEQDLLTYLRSRDGSREHLSDHFIHNLQRALAHYHVTNLDASPALDASLLAIYKSHANTNQQLAAITSILERRLAHIDLPSRNDDLRELLDRLLIATQGRYPTVSDLTSEVRFSYFDEPLFEEARSRIYTEMEAHLTYLAEHPDTSDRQEYIDLLVACPQPLQTLLTRRFPEADTTMRRLMLEILTRRYYRIRLLQDVETTTIDEQAFATATYDFDGVHNNVVTMFTHYAELESAITTMARIATGLTSEYDVVADFYVWHPDPLAEAEAMKEEIRAFLNKANFPRPIRRIVVAVIGSGHDFGMSSTNHFTYRPKADEYQEHTLYRGLHPMMGKRLNIWRLSNFNIKRLPSVEDIYLFHGIARDNPKDERLFAIAEVRDITPLYDEAGKVTQLPHLERMFMEALAGIRQYQSRLPAHQRLPWNRVLLYVWPALTLQLEEIEEVMQRLWPFTEGLGLEKVVIRATLVEPANSEPHERILHISDPGGHELSMRLDVPNDAPISTLNEYRQKVVQLRRRGLIYPYEIIQMLTPTAESTRSHLPPGDFTEYDLNEDNQLVPVERPYGKNKATLVIGVIRNYTTRYPEGMTRVLLLGDPSQNMGSVSEPECRRINEAVNLAERLHVPMEWFALSAGAKISMDSGTENMDWVARSLRRIIEYTQAGGRINIVVNGINVGAQPYWNAEATMLMHTRGTLIMTANGAMVLTGKQSLDYSGGVSAEDNYGIGGYERIMGPNGQAQYFASDLSSACQLLMRYYEHTYVAPGEVFPRRASTNDPVTRDVRDYPYVSTRAEDSDLTRIGDLFSEEKNAGRKHPFDMRKVMAALIDSDHQPLERWHDMRNAESAIVWDAHIGGYPVAMIGIESHPLPRRGFIPGDGPEQWTAGTVFPMSSKKIARTINSASGNRPLVVVANLSGFDGSPESMRTMELEHGAEVGRAVTNFEGPIIFCTISRFHGGSFVVFSKALNEHVEIAAVEGSYASVIGGVPAAAVVFAREVDTRTRADTRIKVLQEQLARADGTHKTVLRSQLNKMTSQVHSEKVGEVASEFDHTHNIQRAQRVGSVDYVIPAARLRPYLVEALERGIAKILKEDRNNIQASTPTHSSSQGT